MTKWLWRASFVVLCLLVWGCSTMGYYRQAIAGHWGVMRERVPLEQIISAQDTSPELRRKLKLVTKVREFASRELHLPNNDSYSSYADLGREFVVWNVFAAPELSLEPASSCFLFVGCLSYRGFFSEDEAHAHAASLAESGHDVFVGGVAAYSTLGWFDDPVLNTMLQWDDLRIVEVIFHELTHQLVYVEGDTVFNESFATTVARVGVERWLAQDPDLQERRARDQRRRKEFLELILAFRVRFESLYTTNATDEKKRVDKKHLYEKLLQEYAQLKNAWSGYDGYDAWMTTDLNNAKLASVATYNDYVPAFQSILQELDGDLVQFYGAVKALADLPSARRAMCLGDPPAVNTCRHEITKR